MAKSLQEQLMGAGLVDNKKAKAIKQEKRKKNKQAGRAGLAEEDAQKKARLEQERVEKVERDRALNEQKKAALHEREIQAQIRQLVKVNAMRVDGETGYQFADGAKIQKIYVDDKTVDALAKGKLALVRKGDSYAVVARPVAEKIAERDSAFVIVLNESGGEQVDEDDPYKDYQIPDDLMW